MKLLLYIFLFIPLSQSLAQVNLSGYVTFPNSVGIDLIRVEVWQNSQQLASTITDSLGYFEIEFSTDKIVNAKVITDLTELKKEISNG